MIKFDAMKTTADQIAQDERLRTLLHAWKGCAPREDFDAEVWRRIRAAPAPGSRPGSAGWLAAWFSPHPVWTGALAASVAIVIGVVAGLARRDELTRHHEANALLHGQTLTGSYLAFVAGETR